MYSQPIYNRYTKYPNQSSLTRAPIGQVIPYSFLYNSSSTLVHLFLPFHLVDTPIYPLLMTYTQSIQHTPHLHTPHPIIYPGTYNYASIRLYSKFHILQNPLPHIHRDTTTLLLRTLPPMPSQLKTSHNTTLLLVNVHYPPPSYLQRSQHGKLTVSRPAMDRLTHVFTDTSISSTIPNRRLLCSSRDHLSPPRSLAQLTRQGMWYISHHLVTLTFAK